MLPQKPAWALGKSQAKQSVEKRRKRGHAKHPAPRMFANAGEQGVRDESDQDAKNNVELKHASESSPVLRWRDLRDVKGSRHGGDANAQAADEARKDESGNICR